MERTKVLVTGATSGIGFETALLAAHKGFEVYASGRSHSKLQSLLEEAKKRSLTLYPVVVDVSSEESVASLREDLLQMTNGYGVDVVVNNAGYAEGGAIEEIPLAVLKKQFDTNVFGLISTTQAFLPMMRNRQKGKIINVSSVVGKVTIPLMGAYCATKYAVEALTDALRMETSSAGIQVVLIEPGSIKTQFGETLSSSIGSWTSPDSPYAPFYKKMQQDRSSERGAHPIVIARAIVSAIESSRPKPRYALPYDSKLTPYLCALLPTRFCDWVVKKVIMG